MTESCTWCGADSPLRQAEDLFGTQLLVCDPRCAMTVERALVYINDSRRPGHLRL